MESVTSWANNYFQSFSIVVLTKYPLRTIIENPKDNDKIAKWITKIRPLRIIFEPRTSIKGKALAHFIAEFTSGPHLRALPWKDGS